MKRIIALLTITIIINFSIFGQNNGIGGDKISELKPGNYRIFNGFSFDELDTEDHKIGLKQRVESEIDYIISDDIQNCNNNSYTVVGYSQGGERVLAYATLLENRINDNNLSTEEREQARKSFNRLKAIITVSGIDKGLLALDGGLDNVKSKIYNDVNIIKNGIAGTSLNATVIVNMLLPGLLPTSTALITTANTALEVTPEEQIVLGLIALLLRPEFDNYIYDAFKGGSKEELAEIYDMIPHSDFINKYICETETETVKVQVGTKIVQEVNWVSIIFGFPIVHTKEVPIYEYYERPVREKTKFNDRLPVGYIAGTNNDTLSMAGEEAQRNVEEVLKIMEDAFAAGRNTGIVEQILIPGFGSLISGSATVDCELAYSWCKNYKDELNELKGSSDNDGLVAVESQYYSINTHSKVLGEHLPGFQQSGYVRYDATHKDISPYTNTKIQEYISEMLIEVNIQ